MNNYIYCVCVGGGGGGLHISTANKKSSIYTIIIYISIVNIYKNNKFNGPFGLKEKEGEWR